MNVIYQSASWLYTEWTNQRAGLTHLLPDSNDDLLAFVRREFKEFRHLVALAEMVLQRDFCLNQLGRYPITFILSLRSLNKLIQLKEGTNDSIRDSETDS